MIFSPALLTGLVGMLGLGSLAEAVDAPPHVLLFHGLLGLGDWQPLLPGPPQPWRVALAVPLLFGPALLAQRMHKKAILDCMGSGLSLDWLARRMTRQDWLVPLAALLAGLVAGMETWVPWLSGSHAAQTAVLLAPLAIAELALRVPQEVLGRRLERLTHQRVLRMGWQRSFAAPVLFTLPIALTGLLDLAGLYRPLEVGILWTTWGQMVLAIGSVGLGFLVLPWLFRLLLPLRREFPAPFRPMVDATAERLGFPRRKLFYLQSGFSVANAFLVGPVSIGRFMAVSDGLIHMLPRQALPGVIAHEVGHARRQHVLLWGALLMAVLMLAGTAPVHGLLEEADWRVTAGLVAALFGMLFLVRRLAFRFELEADAWSAEGLGDTAPILDALREVARTHPGSAHRPGLVHPSDRVRIDNLMALRDDPGHRAVFHRRGRWIRGVLLASAALACVAGAWSSWSAWPDERPTWLYANGRLASLEEELAANSAEPEDEWEQELRAAAALVTQDLPWPQAAERLAAAGWQQGLQAVQEDDLQGAATLLALVRHRRPMVPVEIGVWQVVAALADNDTAEAARWSGWLKRQHLVALPREVLPLIDAAD